MLCLFCNRDMRLTAHHLVPRSQHQRGWVQKKFTKEERNRTVAICRDCHTTIHQFWTEKQLAQNYYTPELLLADEKFARHVEWLKKQQNRRMPVTRRS